MIINMTKAAIPTDLRKKKQQHIFIGLFYRGFDWACVSQIEYKIIRKLQLYSTLAKTKRVLRRFKYQEIILKSLVTLTFCRFKLKRLLFPKCILGYRWLFMEQVNSN